MILSVYGVQLTSLPEAAMEESLEKTSSRFPDDAGVIDVTKAPYFAKGDGTTDDTAAINRALRDHNGSKAPNYFMAWTIYFPKGTYLVSNTLEPISPPSEKDTARPSRGADAGGKGIECSVRFIGDGPGQTIIKLQDRAPGFQNPKQPAYVVRTRNAGIQSNSGYGNYIEDLTVDVGSGNPGAIGVRFDVANCGAMDNVCIVSSDPGKAGFAGLGFFGTCGVGYVKRLTVDGFDHGVFFDHVSDNNIALEKITLRNQRVSGMENQGKSIQILDLDSVNDVPALRMRDPLAASWILNGKVTGTGGGSAIELLSEGFLYLRDVETSGYGKAVDLPEGASISDVAGGKVDEWWSQDNALSKGMKSLRLPIKETPDYEPDSLAEWISVTAFGATPDDDGDDDAPGIQKAIDSGRAVIYFPRGVYTLKSSIVVRGKVRKVDFLFSMLRARHEDGVEIRVETPAGQTVILDNGVLERPPIIHAGAGTLAIRNHKGYSIKVDPAATGDLFVETAGPHTVIEVRNGINAWLRAVNREKSAQFNEGSTLWSFSDNIEVMINSDGPNRFAIPPFKTTKGGKTEIIGACVDGLWAPHLMKDGPLFVVEDSTVSASFAGEMRHTPPGANPTFIDRFNVRERATEDGITSSWPWLVQVIEDGRETQILEKEALFFRAENKPYPRRLVVPMFHVDMPGDPADPQ